MNVHHVHIVIHNPDHVREIIAEATRIADEHAASSDTWQATFEQACRLLGQRATFMAAEQTSALPAALLGRNMAKL